MAAADSSTAETTEPLPADLVEVGVYRTAAEGFEHGLVVLAMGEPCWLVPAEAGHRLLVEPSAAASAREQLARFDRENVDWPPRLPADAAPRRHAELETPLLWTLVLLASYWAQDVWPAWTELGALEPRAIFDRGELWRPLTALVLHADGAHLVSNALGSFGVFAAVLTTVGRRRGWLLIAAAAIAGNFAAAGLNYPGPYNSIGASTAVFAALGLLTGRAVRVATAAHRLQRWRAMITPFAAGLAVLGLYGAGGVQIDVLAHATGFTAGLALGFAAISLRS